MTDHPIPDDLLNRLAEKRAIRRAAGRPNVVTTPDPLDRMIVLNTLRDLASWADGHLIDPDGWRRVKAEEVPCPICRDTGTINADYWSGDADDCPACVDPTTFERRPLFTLTPAPEDMTPLPCPDCTRRSR